MSKKLAFYNSQNPAMLVVGSVAYDNIITPFDQGENLLGGSASYASLASSYYAPVLLVGVVGNDFDPKFIELFKAHDIDLEGLQIDSSGPTFSWKGKYHDSFIHRDTLDLQLNVFEHFRPDLPERYQEVSFVLLGTIHPALQMHVLDQLKNPEDAFVVADTIEIWIETTRDEFEAVLKRIDCLIINDDESRLLTGERNVIKAGHKIHKYYGLSWTIIKKGEHGACLFHEGELVFSMPAYPVTELRDPTGAGDSFAGAFTGYLTTQDSIDMASVKQAMLYATVTASMTVESFSLDRLREAGAEALEVRKKELIDLMKVEE